MSCLSSPAGAAWGRHFYSQLSFWESPCCRPQRTQHRDLGGRHILFSKTGTFSPEEIAVAKILNPEYERRVILWSRDELEPFYSYEHSRGHEKFEPLSHRPVGYPCACARQGRRKGAGGLFEAGTYMGAARTEGFCTWR